MMVKSKTGIAGLSLILASSIASANPIELVLRLKEKTPMEELANSVMDPSSPRYQKFYSPSEIRDQVAPSDPDYQMLVDNLKARGFTVVNESESHLTLTIRAEAVQVESLFKTKFNPYLTAHPGVTSDLRLAGVSSPVTLPSDLSSVVETITGLDQSRQSKPHYHLISEAAKPELAGSVAQADIKKNYGFKNVYTKGITGKGQHIAIATYGGFHIDDVNGFFVQSKISPAPAIDQVNFNGVAAIDENAAVETELDTEFSGMIAPGAKIHVFTSAENSDAGELAMFTAILDDNRAKVVNYSWGSCEASLSASHKADMDKVYARAVAQGVNILVASGDAGAEGCAKSTKIVADWPASIPYAVAVGGTSYALNAAGKLAETAWSGKGVEGGSGGGISTLYPLPAYQSNFQSPYVKRSFPDVAFNANPNSGEAVWTSCKASPTTGACTHGTGHWMNIGGTSMAAPQWSGFMALVNESRTTAKKGALGFLNPIIYSLPASTRAQVFHDVTSGTNGYKAGSGWDAVTGWGSMQADALLAYLTSTP